MKPDLPTILAQLHQLEIQQRSEGKFELAQQTQRQADFYRDHQLGPDSFSHLCCWYDRGAAWPIQWFTKEHLLCLMIAPDTVWLLTEDRALAVWQILSEALGFGASAQDPE